MPEQVTPSIQINPSTGVAAPKPNGATGTEKPAEPAPAEMSPKMAAKAEEDPRFLAALKQTKMARAAQAAAKADRDAAAKDRAEIDAIKLKLAGAKRNPEAAAKELWGEEWYDRLTQYRLNDNKTPADLEVSAVRDEFEQYKKQQADERAAAVKASQEQAEAQRQKDVAEFNAGVKDFVVGGGDDYELINRKGLHHLVCSYIQETHNSTGKLLTTKEAAAKVEEFLEKDFENTKLAKKFQAKQQATNPVATKPDTRSTQPRTISNDMTASTPSAVNRTRSDQERIQAALARLSE